MVKIYCIQSQEKGKMGKKSWTKALCGGIRQSIKLYVRQLIKVHVCQLIKPHMRQLVKLHVSRSIRLHRFVNELVYVKRRGNGKKNGDSGEDYASQLSYTCTNQLGYTSLLIS